MLGLLKLFCVADFKVLVKDDTSIGSVPIPPLVALDTVNIEFTLLTANSGGGISAPWSRVPVAQYSLKIGLFKADKTLLAYQNSWTPDGSTNKFTGSLALTSAAISTLVSSAVPGTPVPVYLEIKITDTLGSDDTVLPAQLCSLFVNCITGALVAAPPGEIAETISHASATYVARDGAAGAPQIMRSLSGKAFSHYIDDDGVPHYDPIT